MSLIYKTTLIFVAVFREDYNGIIQKYRNNFALMLIETSSLDGKYLRNNLNLNSDEIDTLLFLYSQKGYLIGFDDYKGVITFRKKIK